jgi:biotin operon repressor
MMRPVMNTDEDPLAAARLRGQSDRKRLLSEEGGTWSEEQVAKHLEITEQAIRQRREQGTLLGLEVDRDEHRYRRIRPMRSTRRPRRSP